jgi:hypothetical protein
MLVLASMFVVPLIAHAGGGTADLSASITDASPDGPDPVTEGFDTSYDIRIQNHGPDDAHGVQVDISTTGERFVTWYPKTHWTCSDSFTDFGTAVSHAPDLSGQSIMCTNDDPSIPAHDGSHFHVVVRAPSFSPPSPDTFRTSVDGITELDFDPDSSNNTATEETEVVPKTGDDASGFLPPDGGKLKTDGQPDANDDTNSAIRTFAGSGPGGVFELHDLSPNDPDYQDICGNGGCDGKVIEVLIPRGYRDEQNPPKLKMIYDVTAAGAGQDATIWIKKEGQAPQVVPPCDVDGIAKPHPCHGPAHVKHNGDIRYVVYLLSGDPLCGKH